MTFLILNLGFIEILSNTLVLFLVRRVKLKKNHNSPKTLINHKYLFMQFITTKQRGFLFQSRFWGAFGRRCSLPPPPLVRDAPVRTAIPLRSRRVPISR